MKLFKYILVLIALTGLSFADTQIEMLSDANKALNKFYSEVNGGKKFLQNAKGYVVFDDVKEAGFFVGGKYGEGVLYVGAKAKSFHSIASASMGLQIGAQKYSLVIAFTSDRALKDFIDNIDDDWDAKIDFSFAMGEWNSEEELDDIDFGTDMIGFVFDSTGAMGNFTFEGTKFDTVSPD